MCDKDVVVTALKWYSAVQSATGLATDEQLMCAGDVTEDDLVQRYQLVLNRASCIVYGNQGTKFRTYVSCLLYTSPSPRDS